jgi:multidrug efflux pump subunit AcrA (membrane-fusion protein)
MVREGRSYVFVVRAGGVVEEIAVTPGAKLGDVVAVTGAVRSGDKVVVKPPAELKTGALTRPAGK